MQTPSHAIGSVNQARVIEQLKETDAFLHGEHSIEAMID